MYVQINFWKIHWLNISNMDLVCIEWIHVSVLYQESESMISKDFLPTSKIYLTCWATKVSLIRKHLFKVNFSIEMWLIWFWFHHSSFISLYQIFILQGWWLILRMSSFRKKRNSNHLTEFKLFNYHQYISSN